MSIPEHTISGTKPDERALYEAAAAGDLNAREQIILGNLSLAKNIAAQYADRGVPIEDLYQEGCYGIIVALNHFDPSRGTSFASYAKYHVLKYIKLALPEQNSNYPGRYNDRLYAELKRYCAAFDDLSDQYGRPPTDSEMAAAVGRTVRHIQNLKQAARQFLSTGLDINDPLTEIAASTTSSRSLRPIEDTVTKNVLDLDNLDARLLKREEEVLRRRLGFTQAGTPQTWKEISAAMGLSIPWLQNIYTVAIEKLRRAIEMQYQ